ncbi:hypothetical protein NMY22_g18230 [Coprinellus aureogranulatus]|nr:hypothetical protein NMY22_g18230 [Coprinellus aureogranulatus]
MTTQCSPDLYQALDRDLEADARIGLGGNDIPEPLNLHQLHQVQSTAPFPLLTLSHDPDQARRTVPGISWFVGVLLLATFSPVFFYFIWPGKYGLYDMPRLEALAPTTYLDSRAEMALFQMVNWCKKKGARKDGGGGASGIGHRRYYSVRDTLMFRYIITHDRVSLLGMHFIVIPEKNRYIPSSWGSTIWISDSMVLLDFIMRLAWFAGVGRKRYYYGAHNLLGNYRALVIAFRLISLLVLVPRLSIGLQERTLRYFSLSNVESSQGKMKVSPATKSSMALLCTALTLLVTPASAQADQQPLANWASSPPDNIYGTTLGAPGEPNVLEVDPWGFDVKPSPNATHNYIFDTVASLLQQWPNTRHRNGHTLIPATIPAGTLLYHGTTRHTIPSTPEWVALDPEHSYTFCIAQKKGDPCWHLTLATTSPLKLLYFDGSSAAKIRGSLDSQDIIAWGKVIPERTTDEASRIRDLCRWGGKYGLDGFLRMSMDFRLLPQHRNRALSRTTFLTSPTRRDMAPPFSAVSKQDNGTTPTQATPVSSSIYLASYRSTHGPLPKPRRCTVWTGTVGIIGVEKLGEDADGKARLMLRLDEVVGIETPSSLGSGVDWSGLLRVIVHRYADRLEVLRYTLHGVGSVNTTESTKALQDAHAYVKSMLSPYIIHNLWPPNPDSSTRNFTWAQPVFKHCATSHTKVHSTVLLPRLTYSEKLILESVNGVLHEICRVIVGIWAEGVELGIEAGVQANLGQVDWENQVEKLMEWLDWSVWVRCTPACGFEVSLPCFAFGLTQMLNIASSAGNVLVANLAWMALDNACRGRYA